MQCCDSNSYNPDVLCSDFLRLAVDVRVGLQLIGDYDGNSHGVTADPASGKHHGSQPMQSRRQVRVSTEQMYLADLLHQTNDITVLAELYRCVGIMAVTDESSTNTCLANMVVPDHLADEIQHLGPVSCAPLRR